MWFIPVEKSKMQQEDLVLKRATNIADVVCFSLIVKIEAACMRVCNFTCSPHSNSLQERILTYVIASVLWIAVYKGLPLEI